MIKKACPPELSASDLTIRHLAESNDLVFVSGVLKTTSFCLPLFFTLNFFTMEPTYHYETVTEAIRQLRDMGFTEDFNLKKDCLECRAVEYKPDQFEIAEVYHYEGASDPGDEATVYGIVSDSGLKGILVMGDEVDADEVTTDMLKKLYGPRQDR